MFYTYRLGLGKWALLCILFVSAAAIGIARHHDELDPDALPPPAAGHPLRQSAAAFPCEKMVYSISQDGVHYVREAGGGTVYAARLNQQVAFYQLDPYGYMVPLDPATLDVETAGNLSNALLQCLGPWLPSGAWFTLSAQMETASVVK
jgi:hypothetical protein